MLESYKFGQAEVKLAVATFMEEEPRFLDEEEQKKVLRLRFLLYSTKHEIEISSFWRKR